MASSRLPPERRSVRRAVNRPSGGDAVPARNFNRADRAVHHERNRMMARTKRSRRSYSADEWGRNRVRVFPDPRTGIMQVEWREHGRKLRRSLKHRDWAQAKRQADEIAAGLAEPVATNNAEVEPEPLTLGTLFDIYGDESYPYQEQAVSMAIERCTLLAIEKCTLGIGCRGGSEATGAGTDAWMWSPFMTSPLSWSSRRPPPWRPWGGWTWRVPCDAASGSCCPGC